MRGVVKSSHDGSQAWSMVVRVHHMQPVTAEPHHFLEAKRTGRQSSPCTVVVKSIRGGNQVDIREDGRQHDNVDGRGRVRVDRRHQVRQRRGKLKIEGTPKRIFKAVALWAGLRMSQTNDEKVSRESRGVSLRMVKLEYLRPNPGDREASLQELPSDPPPMKSSRGRRETEGVRKVLSRLPEEDTPTSSTLRRSQQWKDRLGVLRA